MKKIRTMAGMFLAGELKCKECGRLLEPGVPLNDDGTVDWELFAATWGKMDDSRGVFQCDRCPPGADLLCADCVGTIEDPPELAEQLMAGGAPKTMVCAKCVEDGEHFLPWRSH